MHLLSREEKNATQRLLYNVTSRLTLALLRLGGVVLRIACHPSSLEGGRGSNTLRYGMCHIMIMTECNDDVVPWTDCAIDLKGCAMMILVMSPTFCSLC